MLAVATATGECGQAGLSVAATIAWVSEGERAKPRRRRGGRRGRSVASPTQQVADLGTVGESSAETMPAPLTENDAANGSSAAVAGSSRPRRRQGARLRTVHEISAGGLVIDGIDGPREDQLAALIGRMDRRGRMIWSLPKGHIEQGETAEQTAIREVAEETGIHGHVLAALGSIDYWFVTEGRRVHKTVHHYLLRFSGGELCDEDVEVTEVAWVPVTELPKRLAYADERRLAKVAHDLIALLQSDGPAALPPLPPTTPALRTQTHSRTRAHHSPDEGSGDPRTNGFGSGA
jgi:8-oxo-dGTP pyrophosphatase MutT (NUDIX family)